MTIEETEATKPDTQEQEAQDPQKNEVPPKVNASATEPQEEWKEKYIRLYAEFENTKKRMQREQILWYRMANKDLILDLLQTVDDLERAIDNLTQKNPSQEDTHKGLTLIHSNLLKNLEKRGLKPMEVEIGEEPDPQKHHILTEVTVQNDTLQGNITQIVNKGYYLHDQVIRHAQVLVGAQSKQ